MITIARKEGVDWDPLKDLTARAYFLLASDHDLPPVKIFLEKTSPVGAGLGGGSSDAAFALKMLNDMFSLGLDKPALADYASRLGSDCAFFVYDDPMFGEGRGEILTPYEGEPVPQGYELKVIVPEDVSVSTADAYKGIVPMENGQRPVSLREALARPVGEWKDVLVNDFETTVFGKHPELAAIKSSLYESGAVYAAMSGSGSALFAIYKV
ncbi:MAG: 4-(cytidine 5'-diphospho)-2-C-methyl-D-erythritol kinase [Bacteroidales bacterium]|nr:4-(cytidine 5'-diphospho)-2-C-methyl-D-erythritol kinase [Bacteroidales bacterium]